MGLGEIMVAVNSDLNEPLNFNNYINDISTFGKYSYVLDPENSNLFRALLSDSLTMFGHSAIHETIYERLTDEDVDYMMTHNGRLGQAFNSFYDIGDFVSGQVDTVLKSITSASYNKLETKLQNGINRYVSDKTSGDDAGEWLGTVFGIDALKTKTNIASIISDSTLWSNTIMQNESLRYVVCLSAATIDWFANNDGDTYIDFINEVCNSTKATMDLLTALDGNDKLATFMNTESVVTVMANKIESMIAVTYMTEPFAAMIASETAMTIVAASNTAMDVIIDSITNVANSETVLGSIKTNMTDIENSLPNIANSEINISEIEDIKANIEDVVSSLQKTTSQADVLANNIDNLTASTTALTALVKNDTSCERICYTKKGLAAICKNNNISVIAQAKINNFDKNKILAILTDTSLFSVTEETLSSIKGDGTVVNAGESDCIFMVYKIGATGHYNGGYYGVTTQAIATLTNDVIAAIWNGSSSSEITADSNTLSLRNLTGKTTCAYTSSSGNRCGAAHGIVYYRKYTPI